MSILKLHKSLERDYPFLKEHNEAVEASERAAAAALEIEGHSPGPSQSTQSPIAEPVLPMPQISELLSLGAGRGMTQSKYPIECREENQPEFEQTLARFRARHRLWSNIPLPTRAEPHGKTDELFTTIKSHISERTHVLDRVSALLTFWIISTWFKEALTLAPCLVITGPAYEGEVILRNLRALCHHPVLMAGISDARLKAISWFLNPTLLISEPNLTPRWQRSWVAPPLLDT